MRFYVALEVRNNRFVGKLVSEQTLRTYLNKRVCVCVYMLNYWGNETCIRKHTKYAEGISHREKVF